MIILMFFLISCSSEILLKMIYPIINLNDDIVVGGVRPLKNQEKLDIVKYLLFDRFYRPKNKFTRFVSKPPITSQSLCLKFDVLKTIGRFTENKKIATDRSMGIDIYSKGYSSYVPSDYRHRIYVDYSSTIRALIKQKTIWFENSLIFLYKNKKFMLTRFLMSFLIALYLFLFPFLLFIHFGLFLIGLFILLNFYFFKIRRLIFFKSIVNKNYYPKFGFIFFIKLIYYIYIEMIIIIRIPIHFLIFLKKLR